MEQKKTKQMQTPELSEPAEPFFDKKATEEVVSNSAQPDDTPELRPGYVLVRGELNGVTLEAALPDLNDSLKVGDAYVNAFLDGVGGFIDGVVFKKKVLF